jgi:DNA repair protein RecN (Recombination protein N)
MGRVAALAGGSLDELVQALDRSAVEVNEAVALLDAACRDLEANPDALDVAEQRLFALRAAARKHKVEVAVLPDLAERLRGRLAGFDDRGREAAHLAALAAAAEAAFREAARALHDARAKAAERLDAAITRELKPLRFEKAVFRTDVAERPAERWGAEGADDVVFTMATNPGSAPGALHRIASGGELARIMLALKVVLARIGGTPTLVFDEVDSGISGAVADAVGARLAKLAQTHQVLVVTHSPQVAARGTQHLHVAKAVEKSVTRVAVTALDEAGKAEEVARMLAGARVTDEARAAAASLIRAGAS